MSNKKILIVEDEPAIADMVKRRLEASGYEVAVAVDGQEGIEKADEEKPNLIILDVMLPKITGFKVARLLKFSNLHKNIPIIMLTARTQESDIELGEEVGADIYMTKPFDSKELLDNIKQLLGE